MKKKILIWTIIGMIMLATTVIGATLSIGDATNVKFTPTSDSTTESYQGALSFKVGGKDIHYCNINEPDGKIDENDMAHCWKNVTGEVSDITTWDGKVYKEMMLGDRLVKSFDMQNEIDKYNTAQQEVTP